MTPTEPNEHEHEHVEPNEGPGGKPDTNEDDEHVEPNQPDEPDDHEHGVS